jgi:hypothetical protein
LRKKLPLWDRKAASPVCWSLAEARVGWVGEGSPYFWALGWEEGRGRDGPAQENSPWTCSGQEIPPALIHLLRARGGRGSWLPREMSKKSPDSWPAESSGNASKKCSQHFLLIRSKEK